MPREGVPPPPFFQDARRIHRYLVHYSHRHNYPKHTHSLHALYGLDTKQRESVLNDKTGR